MAKGKGAAAEAAGRSVREFVGGLFRRGGGASTAASPSIPRFEIRNLPGMRVPPGPSSAFPRQLGSFQDVVGRLTRSTSRAMSPTGFLGKPRGKLTGLAGAGLAGYLGYRGLQNLFGGQEEAAPISYSPSGPTFGEQFLGGQSEADALRELYASPAFTQQLSDTDYAGIIAASNARALQKLEDDLMQVEGIGRESAKAIAGAYADLAKATAGLGEQQQIRSQGLAAEIDRLYQDLGLAEAELAAGGGVSGEPTMVGGLAPMGGEMATAQQTTPMYGASLADYLGREGTIGGQALVQQALSQAAQGAGTATGLQNMILLAQGQQRAAAEQAAAERLAQAQLADAEARRQAEAQRIALAQQQAADLAAAERADAARRQEIQNVLFEARATAEFLWDGASGTAKKQLEAAYGKGAAGRNNFIAAVTENPSILQRFVAE